MTNLLAPPPRECTETATPLAAILLPVHGPLSGGSVANLRERLRCIPPAQRYVVIDCARVSEVEPVGAAMLWRLCIDLGSRGVRVRVTDLPTRFSWRLRKHPVLSFAGSEDELFRDPFAGPIESTR